MFQKNKSNKKYVVSYFDGGLRVNRKTFGSSKILKKAYENARSVKMESEEEYIGRSSEEAKGAAG